MSLTPLRRPRTYAVTAVAALLLAGTAGPADAAPTFTLTAGSAPVGTTVYANGVTTGPGPQVKLTDVTSGTTATCDSATGRGYGKVGPGQPGTGLTTLDASTLAPKNCIGPLNLQLLLDASGLWKLNATKYANGVASGTLTGVDARVHTPDPNQCSFRATGTVSGSFANATQSITTSKKASLRISEVVGCFGLITNGDRGSIELTLTLTPTVKAYNPLSITSP